MQRIIAIALVGACVSPAAGQGPAWPQDLVYARLTEAEILALDCEDVSAGIDRFASECYDYQWEVSRRQVDEAYARALAEASCSLRPRLMRAQKAWEHYAKATCELWSQSEGTWPAMITSRCMAQITRARADELRGLEAIDDL